MKYLLLCQVQPAAFAHVPESAMADIMQAMMGYNQQLMAAGVLQAAGQLADPDTAQRVYTEGGQLKSQPGFALAGDTQIGGYYLIDVASEADAIAWAGKCPAAQFGSLEVRQVVFSPI